MKAVFLFLLLPFFCLAQDMHFSQGTNFSMLINPAFQGMYDGKTKANVSIRNQNIAVPNTAFIGVYNTIGASIETKIFEELSDQNSWSIGFMALQDYAGTGTLATTQAVVSTSYSLSLDRYGRSFLSVGGQLGIVSRRIFSGDLLFESQVREFEFDPRLPNLEPYLDGGARVTPTLNLGVAYQQSLSEASILLLGFSLYNVTKPDDFFLTNSTSNIYSRMNLSGGVMFELDESSKLYPSVIYMKQGPFSQINAGISYTKELNEDLSLLGGLRTRIEDAYILAFGLKYQKWTTTMSYDITTSSLNNANKSFGAIELNVNYIIGEKKSGYGKDKMYCPSY
jgi:type IX secretion system PorP/SprF family membrane protein